MAIVIVAPAEESAEAAIGKIFEQAGGSSRILKGRRRAWIKINAIDCRPETYTSPAVLEAAIRFLCSCAVEEITVIENCTQGNFTRLVFAATGLGEICRRNGARTLFLDEERVAAVELPGLGCKARFPRIVLKELAQAEREVFFLNLPRMKTHSMTKVTLGIKNLLGLMDQRDRMYDHNYNLHRRLSSLGTIFRPDFTIIDGIKAVFHGHYPPASVTDRCLAPLGILIGGEDMLAVDTVDARVLGYTVDEVEHLRLAREMEQDGPELKQIEIEGDITGFTTRYPYTLLPDMPPDVRIVRGRERCCPEGCRYNTEAVLQFLYLDHQGKGGFSIFMGKGFVPADLEGITGPVLLAGKCAVEEAGEYLQKKPGSGPVYRSPACNDLASTVKALTKLMRVNPLHLVPLHPLKSMALLAMAKLKGSKARVAL